MRQSIDDLASLFDEAELEASTPITAGEDVEIVEVAAHQRKARKNPVKLALKDYVPWNALLKTGD